MLSKYAKCPQCKAVLLVKNPTNDKIKFITCPQCKASLQVRFDTPPTPTASTTNDDSKTVADPSAQHKHNYALTCQGITYRLQQGVNTIGRRDTHSTASVQVDTADPYMSRNHAVIRVITLSNGGTRAAISNSKNKNATLVNGVTLQPSDELYLKASDTLTMGKTKLKFIII